MTQLAIWTCAGGESDPGETPTCILFSCVLETALEEQNVSQVKGVGSLVGVLTAPSLSLPQSLICCSSESF